MSITDILVIYLAFGSPLMVHHYLSNARLDRRRRIISALFALAFWVPSVVQMGYRYLSNAYFTHGFVSGRDLDAVERYLLEIRGILKPSSRTSVSGFSGHDFFEALERYVALAAAKRTRSPDSVQPLNLFEVAGRESEIGTACLVRRNRRRIENHHIRARADLLRLFRNISAGDSRVLVAACMTEIARLLDDPGFEAILRDGEQGIDRSWTTEQEPVLEKACSPISSLAIAITPPRSD
ncbi:MAG TPA: hypothetical protein VFZ23_11060 [Pyrinomonadaceae bacterium]